MRITKKVKGLIVVLTLLIICTSTGFANNDKEILQVVSSNGRTVNFTIEPNIQENVSTEELISIADSNVNSDNITIIDVGYALPEISKNISQKSVQANVPIIVASPPVKNYTSYNNFQSDRFMASCARGETKTITQKIDASLSSNISGDTPVGSLGITSSITYTITVGTVLTGPSESSSYNTREYRCKFYQNKGNWGQVVNIDGWDFSRSGTFTEPSKYISYSIDTNAY